MIKSKVMDLRAVLLTLCMCMMSFSLVAQVTVTGTVQETTGEPVIGATVREKGANTGTITDMDGNFSLKVANANATLIVSYVGLETQEVKLAGRSKITVELKNNDELLDEVVVVGYGTMKKSDLSGSSATMTEDKLKGSVITNIDQSFQGRVAGVTAVQTSGAPGSSSAIRVRGQATINAGAEPLYVIDGVIFQGSGQSGASVGLGDKLGNGSVSTISPLSTINPADIVSMEILKDASATAIYGAQGSNGVVLITTKRGKSGDAKFSYDGMMAFNRQQQRLDMLNLREFAEYYNDFVDTYQGKENPAYSDPSVLGVGTNWQDAIFRTALQQQHQVSAQGGSEKVQYYVSGGFMDQEGTLIGSNFNRYSLRTNLDAQMKSWLKLGMSVSFSNTDEKLLKADQDEGVINYSLQTTPDIPIYNIDGSYATIVREGYNNPNPVALALEDDLRLKRQQLNGNVFLDITPIKNLVWHTELGYDLSWSKADYFIPSVNLGSWVRPGNESSIQKNSSLYWAMKNYLTYNGKVNKHSYSLMVGQEAWESKWDYTSVKNTNLPANNVHNPALGTGTPTIGAGFGSAAMASFFTRETYNYDNRYLATYTYRYDGSSNFGPNKRWAGFHSFAASWRFTNEKFFESIKGVLNEGKIRLGWGQTGNASIGGYKWGAATSVMESALGTSYRPANIANRDIKWESQEQWNVGVDLSFLESKYNLTVELYKKTSKDMLMPLQLPSYMGTSGNGSSALAAPWGNYGNIENKGLEITLNTHPLRGGVFEWDSEAQISFNKNKLVALAGTSNAAIVGYGMWTDVVTMSQVGESLYSFYGYVTDGIYQDFDDIQNSAKPVKYPFIMVKNAEGKNEIARDENGNVVQNKDAGAFSPNTTVWVGDVKYKDINGDGIIDENDRTNIGSPMPKFTFGLTNTFRYKNLDLSIFINGSYGNKVFNYLKMKMTHMNSLWGNQMKDVTGRTRLAAIDGSKNDWYWDVTNVRVKNPGASLPRATTADPNDNDRISDRYVEDGSYLRVKNITLGYTFPKKMIKRIGLENLRVYTNIQNLWTITGYDGYDPEIGTSTASSNVMGLDNGRYPSPTVYSMGINVSF